MARHRFEVTPVSPDSNVFSIEQYRLERTAVILALHAQRNKSEETKGQVVDFPEQITSLDGATKIENPRLVEILKKFRLAREKAELQF